MMLLKTTNANVSLSRNAIRNCKAASVHSASVFKKQSFHIMVSSMRDEDCMGGEINLHK